MKRQTLYRRVVALVVAAGALLMGVAMNAQAKIANHNLTGNVQFDGWDVLASIPGYGFNDVGPDFNGPPPPNPSPTWPAPLGSMEVGSGDGTLDRTSGTHYSASLALYSFVGGSDFTIGDSSAIADLATVVLTIADWEGGSPSSAPLLSYNGGSQELASGFTSSGLFGTVNFSINGSTDPLDVNARTFQWDLTGLGVTSFRIDWNAPIHTGITALQLEQSDEFTQAAAEIVPVPASMALLGIGGLAALRRRSHR